ncbi:MAG TPA: cytochrome C oxidase subunit IV family protein [Chloroflexota bacterium]|nr:cytochrome C oxidase subunit IV family protein [Chloroflexota bacterium]
MIYEENPIHQIPTPTQMHEGSHPSAQKYIVIAVILTILTAVEVAVYYVESLRPILIPLLGILGLSKFVLVVGYYMHLKFDPKLFTWLFVGGLVTATAALTGLWALFNGWGG